MQEEWKTIENYSRYKISNLSRVWDTKEDREMPQTWNGGFLCTNLISDGGTRVLCKIHRLVALSFLENPENAHNVVHKHDNRSNNSADNLYWKGKRVKEVVVKEVKTLTFLDRTYTYEEFCEAVGCDIRTLKNRLNGGWSVRECFTGIKEFSGSGYSGEGMWFTNKKDLANYLWTKELERRKHTKLQRQAAKEARKQAREEYKKFGVGVFVNYPIPGIINRLQTIEYKVWSGMLSRCYSPKNQNYSRYGGRGVRVCDDWLYFQNFARWYREQYFEDGWHIDKDVLVEGNLLYSPETCTLVPPAINTFFATMPKGAPAVIINGSKFLSQGKNENSEKVYLNCDSSEEAIAAYWKNKLEVAKALADKYYGKIDIRVYFTLYDLKPN